MELVSDISLTKWLVAVLALIFCMGALAILAKRFGPQGRSMSGGRRMQLLKQCTLIHATKSVYFATIVWNKLLLLAHKVSRT